MVQFQQQMKKMCSFKHLVLSYIRIFATWPLYIIFSYSPKHVVVVVFFDKKQRSFCQHQYTFNTLRTKAISAFKEKFFIYLKRENTGKVEFGDLNMHEHVEDRTGA